MSRVTVRWHPQAEKKLADIWLGSDDRDAVAKSADSIERELRSNPSLKGFPYALAHLRPNELVDLYRRSGSLPENLRRLSRGIIEVFFVAREEDGMAIVYLIRHATTDFGKSTVHPKRKKPVSSTGFLHSGLSF